MSSHPFYQPPTVGRKIVHPFLSFLYYVLLCLAFIVGPHLLVALLAGR